ncbi:MAG: AMP-binding protein [Betaproteobacteria bacterium]|jgi:long-chain acyl-CoA synthetase
MTDAQPDRPQGAERPWLRQYPPGVAAEIGPLPHPTVPALVDAAVKKFGDRAAFENFGVRLSYRDVDHLSRDFAAWLQQGLGLKKGDRVAVMMPNLLQYPVALFGILRAGMVVVSVNPLYTPRELEHQLQDSGASAIVIFEGAAAVLQQVLRATPVRTVVVASVGDMLGLVKGTLLNFVLRHVKKMVPAWSMPGAVRFPEALARGAGLRFEPPAVDTEDLAFLQYTGGTTGVSKGAMLKHRNVLADVEQVHALFRGTIKEGEEVAVAPLPFYHILALVMNCMMHFSLGSRQILITNPRDIPRLVKTLDGSGFTFFVGVNTLYNALAHNAEFARLDFSAVKVFGGGGAPLQLAVAERWKRITSRPLLEGYGLTETSGAATINPPTITDHTGTAGIPTPGTEIEIRDELGNALPLGGTGEVCIRGPQVMAGYWNRPDETARAIGKDGFFASGDIGQFTPEGYLKIVDRLKDMVLVSGFNVYPNEVEDVLAAHPGILEAAVIGVPDEHSGEVVKAVVVRKDPSLTAEAVIAHCHANLTGYKVPKQVEFRDALPKTPVGKILRRELRAR